VHAIDKRVLCSHQTPTIRQRHPIVKSEEVMQHLRSMTTLSPTAINRYLRCPIMFFFNYVAGIKEPNDESDVMDNLKFGNIFHDASQMIYDMITGVDRENLKAKDVFTLGGHDISPSMIEHVLNDPTIISRNLNKAIMNHLFKNPDGDKVPDLNGLQLINIKVIHHYLRQLMKIDHSLAPFTIRGLEGDVFTTIVVKTSEGERQLKIGGRIDRLDEVTDRDGVRRIRVVDYKTGVKDVKTSLSGIDDVFDSNKIDNHSDYYLQAMLYSMIVRGDTAINPNGLEVSPALLFIQKTQQDNYSPVLKFGNQEIKDIQPYIEAFEQHLSALIAEIMEPSKPFEPTTERKRCANCIYSNVCGNYASESNSAELHQHANDENSGSDSNAK
ncbi:MAG: PD-(D/E)XK nuclease family protein, partial [Prevotella sp.]|nr:PD-(D/E)XK nuclease family protein [Prevotella sp.]